MRLQALRNALSTGGGHRRVELYSRSARRLRVRFSSGKRRTESGVDEGLALRVGDRRGRELGFAAASGADVSTVRWLWEEAAHETSTPHEEAMLARPGTTSDLADTEEEFPSVDRLSGELERLSRGGGEAWLEAAATVEALRTDDGPAVVRTRLRYWAMVRLAGIPHLRASRRLETLEAPEESRGAAEDPELWVLAPEAAATIVRGLIATLGPTREIRCRIRNEPSHPKAIAGGTFDDAGHPASRQRISLGQEAPAAGRLLRPSFMDPPRPGWSVPVLEADAVGSQPAGVVAVGVIRIHPLSPDRWLLELPEQGRITPACRPASLARAILGGIGQPRATPDGTITPALVMDARQAVA